jgi:predicted enzyme related to lactoylglutathione lyase
MQPVSSVSALVFYVKDLDRTETFYQDVLGLRTERSRGHENHYLTADAGDMTLVFLPGKEPSGRSPIVVFGLNGGIDDAVEALARHNVEIVVPVSEAPDGGLTADFKDPDEHVLSFHQPAGVPRRMSDPA